MNWDLMWAVVVVGVVAQLSYTAGHWTGFKAGVVGMRKEVVRLLKEEVDKMEERDEELSDCGANERDRIMEAREDERKKTP